MCNTAGLDPLGYTRLIRQVGAPRREESHTVESRVAALPVVKIGIRDPDEFEIPFWSRLVEIHKAFRLRKRQGPQKQAVEDAEYRCIARDTQREHENYCRAE